jgi:hypothetical protein
MRSFVFIILFLISLLVIILQSYSYEVKTKITPLEYLKTDNQFIRDIIEQVLSSDRYAEGMALYQMEKSLQDETYVTIANELLCILYHLCIRPDNVIDKASYLHTQKRSVELIGRLGEKTRDMEYAHTSKDILIEVLDAGNDISIAASTIFALGMVGLDDEGDVMRAILFAVEKWGSSTENNLFALAVITSIEKIAEVNDGITELEGYTALKKIMRGNYDGMIKERAMEVMKHISMYKEKEEQ